MKKMFLFIVGRPSFFLFKTKICIGRCLTRYLSISYWDLIKFPYFADTTKRGVRGWRRSKDKVKTRWLYKRKKLRNCLHLLLLQHCNSSNPMIAHTIAIFASSSSWYSIICMLSLTNTKSMAKKTLKERQGTHRRENRCWVVAPQYSYVVCFLYRTLL